MKRWWMLLVCLLVLVLGGGPALGGEAVIPELDIARQEIPENEALKMIQDMKAGWNLGNTFDAFDCSWLQNGLDYETGWCGVRTTEKLIDGLKAAGFRTLRIPVSWHNHLDADWNIDPAWMDRVCEVAGWACDRGMYVILNIHHDCARDYYYPDSEHLENSARYIRTIWTQIADRFGDYDEHLIFESINEPPLAGTSHEWYWEAGDPECRDAMACIMKLNQVFVDTVRASGGKNAQRYLMVPSYDASPDYACAPEFQLPEDPAENRIIVSAHAYTPYHFALEMPGTDSFSLATSQKNDITGFLDRLYRKYVSRGVPVLIGEFGAMEKNGNLQDRVDWAAFYVAAARSRGITCCWWDNNVFEGNGERFGLFNRTTGECALPEILEAIMKYCE